MVAKFIKHNFQKTLDLKAKGKRVHQNRMRPLSV
jgi:hypothetical protein